MGPHITLFSFLTAGIRGCSIRPALQWLLSKPTWRKEEEKKCEDPSAFFAPAPRDEGANLVTGGMIRITSGSVEICSSGTYHTQGPVLDSGAKKEPAFFNKHADIHKL